MLSRVLGTEPGFRKWDVGLTALFSQESRNQVSRDKRQNLVKGDITCTTVTSPHYTGLLSDRVTTKSRASTLKGSCLLEAPGLHRDIKYQLTPLVSTPLTLSICESSRLRVPAMG